MLGYKLFRFNATSFQFDDNDIDKNKSGQEIIFMLNTCQNHRLLFCQLGKTPYFLGGNLGPTLGARITKALIRSWSFSLTGNLSFNLFSRNTEKKASTRFKQNFYDRVYRIKLFIVHSSIRLFHSVLHQSQSFWLLRFSSQPIQGKFPMSAY